MDEQEQPSRVTRPLRLVFYIMLAAGGLVLLVTVLNGAWRVLTENWWIPLLCCGAPIVLGGIILAQESQ